MKQLDFNKPLRMKRTHEPVEIIKQDKTHYLAIAYIHETKDLALWSDLSEIHADNSVVAWRTYEELIELVENVPEIRSGSVWLNIFKNHTRVYDKNCMLTKQHQSLMEQLIDLIVLKFHGNMSNK